MSRLRPFLRSTNRPHRSQPDTSNVMILGYHRRRRTNNNNNNNNHQVESCSAGVCYRCFECCCWRIAKRPSNTRVHLHMNLHSIFEVYLFAGDVHFQRWLLLFLLLLLVACFTSRQQAVVSQGQSDQTNGRIATFRWTYCHIQMDILPHSDGRTATFRWTYCHIQMDILPHSDGRTATFRWTYCHIQMDVLTFRWTYCHIQMDVLSHSDGRTATFRWTYCHIQMDILSHSDGRTVTFRWTFQVKLALSLSRSTLTPGRPLPALTL